MKTSVSAGPAVSALIPRTTDSLAGRVIGVFRAPRTTLEAVASAPRSAGVLAFGFVVNAASTAALLATDVGHLALADYWERTATAFGQTLTDAQYAAILAASQQGTLYAAVAAFVSGPVVAVALSAVLFGVLRTAGPRPRYRQVLAVVAHAGVILSARQAIAAPVSYVREALVSPGSLNPLFGMLDEGSPLARFFSAMDVFVIWWIVVVAIGLSILYRKPARRVALVLVGVYVALALALAGVMAVTGGSA